MQNCAQARVDGGSHFPFASEQSRLECPKVGKNVYEWLQRLIDGTEPFPGPFTGLPLSNLPETMGPYTDTDLVPWSGEGAYGS